MTYLIRDLSCDYLCDSCDDYSQPVSLLNKSLFHWIQVFHNNMFPIKHGFHLALTSSKIFLANSSELEYKNFFHI